MKKFICFLMLSWVMSVGFAADPAGKGSRSGASTTTTEFTLVRQENNIAIFILDDDSFTSWMKGTRDYYRVETVDSSSWYSYIQFSIPWPLNDQDCIIHYRLRRNSESYLEVFIDGEPGYLAPVEGVKRISHMQGSWKLLEVSPEKTVIEYLIFSNQPSSFPRWITDPIIQNNMIRTMTAFREQVISN